MVVLDTNVYIYFLEKSPTYFTAAEKAITYALEQKQPIAVSSLTLTEILSGTDSKEVAKFFSSSQFIVHDLSKEIAILAGQLRRKHKALKTADAIHIATAIYTGAREFITNDEYLLKLKLEIKVVELKKFK